jgi:hypothetical protein
MNQCTCLLGCCFITLNDNLVPPCADGYAERLFDEFKVLGKTSVQEGKFLFCIKIYLCSNRIRSSLIFYCCKGIKTICLFELEGKYFCLSLSFKFTYSHLEQYITF